MKTIYFKDSESKLFPREKIYFEDSESIWKTITYENDEYKKDTKKPLYLEFALRLPSGDLIEFENDEDDVVINLKTKA